MKGVVFTEFLEMVEAAFSADLVDDLLASTELASGGSYTAVGSYDHGEMIALVVRLSELSGLPVPDLVRRFGQHLFGRFHLLYPGFFTGVADAMDFLARIEDVIHVEVRKLYPDAELPRFEIERPDPLSMTMTYRSCRPFGDLAEGLILGCIDHYGEPIAVSRSDFPAESGHHVRFRLQRHPPAA